MDAVRIPDRIGRILGSDDHLQLVRTLGDQVLGDLDELLPGVLREAERHVGRNLVASTTEQSPDGLVVVLPREVPESDIDRAHGRTPDAGLVAGVQFGPELALDPDRFAGIGADQDGRDFAVHVLPDTLHVEVSRLAVAGVVGVGFDGDEDDRYLDRPVEERRFDRHCVGRCFDGCDLHRWAPTS